MQNTTRSAGPSNRHLSIVQQRQSFAARWATLVSIGATTELRARALDLGPRDGGTTAARPRPMRVIELHAARAHGAMRVAA